jgi:hypothetical protein
VHFNKARKGRQHYWKRNLLIGGGKKLYADLGYFSQVLAPSNTKPVSNVLQWSEEVTHCNSNSNLHPDYGLIASVIAPSLATRILLLWSSTRIFRQLWVEANL